MTESWPGMVLSEMTQAPDTHGGHTYGAAMVFRGTANIPGLGPDGKPWTWDTSFSALEPNTGTTGHPLSAIVNIAQNRPSND